MRSAASSLIGFITCCPDRIGHRPPVLSLYDYRDNRSNQVAELLISQERNRYNVYIFPFTRSSMVML